MRRLTALKRSFPFLPNFHVYRVSFVSPRWQISAVEGLFFFFWRREDMLEGPPDLRGRVGFRGVKGRG